MLAIIFACCIIGEKKCFLMTQLEKNCKRKENNERKTKKKIVDVEILCRQVDTFNLLQRWYIIMVVTNGGF